MWSRWLLLESPSGEVVCALRKPWWPWSRRWPWRISVRGSVVAAGRGAEEFLDCLYDVASRLEHGGLPLAAKELRMLAGSPS